MLPSALTLPALRIPTLQPRQWLATLVLAMVLGLNILAGISILGGGTSGPAGAKVPLGVSEAVRAQTPPAPEPLRFREIAPADAVAINAAIPLADVPNPPARPFMLAARTEADKQRAIECLTSAIYYEAAIEPLEGQKAVAQVVLNRVRHPAYPNSVCGVVYQGSERRTGCQFTFTCDGALARTPIPSIWQKARRIAEAALSGSVYKPVGWATHYHTNWVVPYWSSSLVKAALVGTHIFYRWTGGWGTGPAFRTRYAGTEMDVTKLRHLSNVPAEAALGSDAALTDLAAAEEAAKAIAAGTADSLDRTVVRRYEPAKAEGVATLMADQARSSGDAVTASYRWALTGSTVSKEAPLGRKAETKSSEAKPEPPKELEGVRRAGEPTAPAITR
jgi:spore germination cell wall hydrolase CwlJ-like protein